jgi:DNA polymerase III epsilon subunit-like protein
MKRQQCESLIIQLTQTIAITIDEQKLISLKIQEKLWKLLLELNDSQMKTTRIPISNFLNIIGSCSNFFRYQDFGDVIFNVRKDGNKVFCEAKGCTTYFNNTELLEVCKSAQWKDDHYEIKLHCYDVFLVSSFPIETIQSKYQNLVNRMQQSPILIDMYNVIKDQTCFLFDTETTGIPKTKGWDLYYPSYQKEHYESSRIIEIAWIKIINNIIISEKSYLIKPNGFIIPQDSIKKHGITQKIAEEQGVTWDVVLKALECDLKDSNIMVSHNILFDYNVLLSDLFRLNTLDSLNLIDSIINKKLFCTMKDGKNYLGEKKNPKLEELYNKITGKNVTGSHRALDDTKMLLKCFQKMVGPSLINLK